MITKNAHREREANCNVKSFVFSDVKDISIDMDKQRVYVISDASADDLLAALKKTGKKISYIGTV